MNKTTTMSFLMALYHGDKPADLDCCLSSIYQQTRLPEEIVMIVDGPISRDLQNVLTNYQQKRTIQFTITYLPDHKGLAHALNYGARMSTSEWLVRIDADDWCVKERLEVIEAYIRTHRDVDIFASQAIMWNDDNKIIESYSSSPETNERIYGTLIKHNCLIHSSIAVRRNVLMDIPYDETFHRTQDYEWYMHLRRSQKIFYAIQSNLVYHRISALQVKRSSSWRAYSYKVLAQWRYVLKKDIPLQSFLWYVTIVTYYKFVSEKWRLLIRKHLLPRNYQTPKKTLFQGAT